MPKIALTYSRAVTIFVALIISAHFSNADMITFEAGRGVNQNAVKAYNEAESKIRKGDFAGARQLLDAVIRLDPTFWPAIFSRAQISLTQHKWDLAIQDCNDALRLNRAFPEASLVRAEANFGAGRYAAALKEANYVVDISHPRLDTHARALAVRSEFYSTCPDRSFRKPQQAIKDAETACRITKYNDNSKLSVLASAYASAGDFDSAIKYQEKAISLSADSPGRSRGMQRDLELLKQHKPLTLE